MPGLNIFRTTGSILKKFALKLKGLVGKIVTKRQPVSHSSFEVGQIYSMDYKGKPMVVLCVSNKRTGRGKHSFISTRGNKLLSMFALDNASESELKAIISKMYGNEDLADYHALKEYMLNLLGKDCYYTPKLSDIGGLFRLDIELIPEDEIED